MTGGTVEIILLAMVAGFLVLRLRSVLGRRLRLAVAEFGELGVVDARVAARGREVQVELALPVSQQDHRGVRRGAPPPARQARPWWPGAPDSGVPPAEQVRAVAAPAYSS